MHACVCSCVDSKVLMRTVEELTFFTGGKYTYHLLCVLKSEIVLASDTIYKLQDSISLVLQGFIGTLCFYSDFIVNG